ncbi:Glyoxylate/hydroxypyruvate reductase HPR3 [Vitis vinifera]|uniref:glyoxylate reductase (NADP(+)) n=1 Tax=Vitis vinifera TaxID=29760 RepID=A0A438JJ33_VITVI|nr:Glyoxylate/hydroxypyruvate reductase HPR3 [Vitis vinifera]
MLNGETPLPQNGHRRNSMAAITGEAEAEAPGVVFVHGSPPFGLPFKDRLLSRFQLIHMSELPESSHVKVMLCMDHTPVTSQTLYKLPSLECIVASSAGVDHIDLTTCRLRGIAVANGSQAFSEDVADYAVALLMDVLRKISAGDRYLRSGLWSTKGDYPLGWKVGWYFLGRSCGRTRIQMTWLLLQLGRKRVGIVGLGNIGSEVAKRLVAFGCGIAYNSRKKRSSVSFPYYADVCDLAANSDILVICCALTSETHHIINKDVMTALGKEGVIINVGRGSLINEKELVQFLVEGQIREAFEALQELAIANLEAFFSNKPLLSPI